MENYQLKIESSGVKGCDIKIYKNLIIADNFLEYKNTKIDLTLHNILNIIETYVSFLCLCTSNQATYIIEISKKEFDIKKVKKTILNTNKAIVTSVCENNTKIAILYENNTFIIYDDYFEKICEHSVEIKNDKIHVEWLHDGYGIAIVTNRTYIFTKNFTIKKEVQYTSPLAWKGDYNVFAIQNNNRIEFLEPNGLLHGKGFDITGKVKNIFFYNCKQKMMLIVEKDEKLYVKLYVSSNYHWYLKVQKRLHGDFVGFYDDVIYYKKCEQLYKISVQANFDTYNNIFYMIDKNKIKITNLEEKIIPLPYYDTEIELKDDITAHYSYNNSFFVIAKDILYKFDFNSVSDYIKYDMKNLITDFEEDEIYGMHVYNNKLIFELLSKQIRIKLNDLTKNLNSKKIETLQIGYFDSLEANISKISIDDASKHAANDKRIMRIMKNNNEYQIKCDSLTCDIIAAKLLIYKTFVILYAAKSLTIYNLKTLEYEKFSIYDTNMRLVTFVKKTQQILLQAQRGNFELHKSKLITKDYIQTLLKDKKYKEAINVIVTNFINFSIVTETKLDFDAFFDSFTNENAYTNCVVQIYNNLQTQNIIEKKHFDIDKNIENLQDFATKLLKIQKETEQNDISIKIVNNMKKELDTSKENDNTNEVNCDKNIDNNTYKINKESKRVKNNEFLDAETFLSKICALSNNTVKLVVIYSKLNRIEDALLYIYNTKLEYINILKNYFAEEEIIKESLGLYDFVYTRKIIEMLQKDMYLEFIDAYKDKDEIEKRIMINKLLERKNKVVFYIAQTNDLERESKYIKDAGVYEILPALEKHNTIKEDEKSDCDSLKQQSNLEKEKSKKKRCKYAIAGNNDFCKATKNKNNKCLCTFLNTNDVFLTRNKREQGFYILHYADYKYKTDKKESIQYYIEAKRYEKAIEVAFEIEDYDTILHVNKKHLQSEKIYKKCIEGYMTKMNFNKIAEIYSDFLDDKTSAYDYYLMDCNYGKCYELSPDKFISEKNKLLSNDLEALQQNIEYIKENIKRFDAVIERIKNNADETQTETTFTSQRSKKSTKTKLRNKVGSRYEKEYALDQIRQTLLKIMVYKNSWDVIDNILKNECCKEMQNILKKMVSEIENDYERLFAYENTIYDSDRPVIDKIDIKRLL